MTVHISPADLRLLDAEPRVQDLRLAEALAFRQVRDIRKLIDRNLEEVRAHGQVCATMAQTSPEGGRPGTEYWLNEPQALLVCMFSRTERAAAVRAELIAVFMDWRRGHPTPAPEAQFEFPSADGPLAEHLAKVATLRECRLIHGPRAAARLWRRLGMPQVTESVIEEADDGRACLGALLRAESEPGSVRAEAIAALIERALDGNDAAQMQLKACGVAVVEGDDEGILVANRHAWLHQLYDGTPWASGLWRQALRKLPGASPSRRVVFEGYRTRATFIPAAAIDTYAFRPETGGNVVALRPQ